MTPIDKALILLNQDDVVAIPTETVYGLAASIESQAGIEKIFATKERPFFDPLIVHVDSIAMASSLVKNWTPLADRLAKTFWPGPLTLVLEKSDKVSDVITSGLTQVGLRCPRHPLALELITRLQVPLAAPSANKFTKTSPTTARHVEEEFDDTVFVIDGGPCEIGIESTVVGIDEKSLKIYRPGMISKEEIIKALAKDFPDIEVDYAQSPVAPGQMKHHYMPKKPVTLTTTASTDSSVSTWIVPNDATLAARELYGKLRQMDQENTNSIHIVLKKEYQHQDLWQGVLNRLSKAKTFDHYFS
jgi:L-threonylcarbamoyladenylate synthase